MLLAVYGCLMSLGTGLSAELVLSLLATAVRLIVSQPDDEDSSSEEEDSHNLTAPKVLR